MTENQISGAKARNIEWLFSGSPLEDLICRDEKRNQSMEYFLYLYRDGEIRFPDMLREVEYNFDLEKRTGVCIFKVLVISRKIILKMEKPINLSESREQDGLWGRKSM